MQFISHVGRNHRHSIQVSRGALTLQKPRKSHALLSHSQKPFVIEFELDSLLPTCERRVRWIVAMSFRALASRLSVFVFAVPQNLRLLKAKLPRPAYPSSAPSTAPPARPPLPPSAPAPSALSRQPVNVGGRLPGKPPGETGSQNLK